MKSENYSDDLLHCSFCGKFENAVKKLIAGRGVYICDSCVKLCNEILEIEGNEGFPKTPKEKPTETRKKLRCCICGEFAEDDIKPLKTAFGELIFCDKCREKLSKENFIIRAVRGCGGKLTVKIKL